MSKYQTLINTHPSVLISLIKSKTSKMDIMRHYGFAGMDSRALKFLREFITDNNVSIAHWTDTFKPRRKRYTESQLITAVQNAMCMSDVLRELNLSTVGGNGATIKRHIEHYNLDISHFDVAKTRQRGRDKLNTIDSVFCKNSKSARSVVRRWILTHNLLPQECSRCKITEWQGETLSLDIDHEDGDRTNNEITNLRFLCPNCHSLTPTFRGKNNKS